MRDFRILAFDEIIAGTTTTWYTSSDNDSTLGSADGFSVQAVTTSVSSPAPTLNCQFEHSGNTRDWVTISGTTVDISGTIANDGSLGATISMFNPTLLANVRVKIWLTNQASAQCRLKLFITGRVSRVGSAAPQLGQAIGQPSGRGM